MLFIQIYRIFVFLKILGKWRSFEVPERKQDMPSDYFWGLTMAGAIGATFAWLLLGFKHFALGRRA